MAKRSGFIQLNDGPRHDSAGYNDPPPGSLFFKWNWRDCICKICRGTTSNNTEGRDAHLNKYGCHVS